VRFGYACGLNHEVFPEVEEHFPIGQAPDAVACWCGSEARRVFEAPYYQEDRRRLARTPRNAPAEKWSWTLGARAPQSRAEMRQIEKERGIEFVTPAEARADIAKLREGKNLEGPPKPNKGWLAKEIAKRGVKLHPADSGGWNDAPHTREGVERKIKAERGWNDAEAVVVSKQKIPPA
jgi:hypothetical protein